MKKKLCILYFIVEGFTQIGEGSEGDDEDPDLDIGDEDNKVGETYMSATQFHPMILNDEVHEQFIEEAEIKTPPTHVEGLPEAAAVITQEDMDICSHMEYCSAQLRKFEMGDSEGEDDVLPPEMVCLPEKLASNIGSTKRSLMESLEMAKMEKKLKGDSFMVKKWGHVLSTRPITRQHGNIKIMEKATAYLQKKNLEIPTSFQGTHMERSGLQSCQVKRGAARMGGSLQHCTAGRAEAIRPSAGQASRGAVEDSLALI
ncbi:hypothetical protein D1007_20728 [Hordeum vulgare]|nr:hypothetical protein D1007_20728 [Hordeum vulgare]